MINKKILHYKIIEKLGEGGMGIVYKAEDTKLNREVAIKVLPPHLLVSEDDRARFNREAKAAAALNHANIATVYEINEQDGKPFIVMEYVPGQTLNHHIEKGPFKLEDAVAITIQIAEGLKAAHAKDIVHRDIKSSNVLLGPENQAKILDFGLAKTSISTKLTQMGTTVGTVAYMSPEQIRAADVDNRTDLWSLGVLLYEMIAGQLPFKAEYDQAVFYSIQNENPAPLTAIRTGVPMSLEWIVNKLMTKDPAERYQSAGDLIIDLKAVDLKTSGFSRVSAVTSPKSKIAKPKATKNTVPLASGIGLLSLIIILASLLFISPNEPGLDLSEYKYTPFETEGVVSFGRWSPDGKSIAYRKLLDGEHQIHLRVMDKPRSTLLTTLENIQSLFWSPDGKHLYFISDYNLQTIGLAGGNPKTVLTHDLLSAAISPDNKTIALWTYASEIDSTYGDSVTILISTVDGAEVRRYKPDPFKMTGAYSPVYMKFSPDGSKLALTTYTSDVVEFWILPWPDGSAVNAVKLRKIFKNKTFTGPPWFEWLADSRQMILNYENGMWLGDTEEESLQRITSSQQGERLSSVSNDGKRILFEVSNSNYDILKLAFDGSDPVPVKSSLINEYSATYSHDGTMMSYITDRSGKDEIWLEEQNGIGQPIVTNSDFAYGDSGSFSVAIISPDGKRVAYNRSGENSLRELWVSNAEGGKPVLMFPDNLQIRNPCWSPDGERLYANISDGDTSYSVIAPIGSGETIHLADSMNTFGLPAWSPDDKWIALKQEERLLLITADAKQSKIIIPPVNPSPWRYCMVWSRDSKKIYIASSVEKISRLDEINVLTGKSHKIAEYGYDIRFGHGLSQASTASISRDGKGIVVSAYYRSGSLHILDGALDK